MWSIYFAFLDCSGRGAAYPSIASSLCTRSRYIVDGFQLVSMGDFRGTPLSHCSCMAGQRLQPCKHLARLLQCCIKDFPRLGSVADEVPEPVHSLALQLEQDCTIFQTSSHQRRVVPVSKVNLETQERIELAAHGYISPHYTMSIARFCWNESTPGVFTLVPSPPTATAPRTSRTAAVADDGSSD